jgi:hypothetical protein
MPTEKPGAGSRREAIRPHPLVEKLASDPANPPHRLVRLVGYPGPSPVNGMTRLWLSLDFRECVDIPDGAVAHFEEGAENGPSTLFVVRGTKLEHTVVSSSAVQADFLSGEITARNLAGALAVEQRLGGAIDWKLPFAPSYPYLDCGIIPSALYRCPRLPPEVFLTQRFLCTKVGICAIVSDPRICDRDVDRFPEPGTPLIVDIVRDVVRETIQEVGLNPQPLPPRGPLTRPG